MPGAGSCSAFSCCSACLPRPTLSIPQKLHRNTSRTPGAWEAVFPEEQSTASPQTPDGYLWIGSDEGLIRFDGTTFRIVTPPGSIPLSFRGILSLAATPEGSLWIRLQDSTIFRYQNGIFHEVPVHTRQRSSVITVMYPQENGVPLLTIVTGGSLRFDGTQFEDVPGDLFEPDSLVISLARTGDGKFWKGTRDSGLSYLSDGGLVPVRNGLPDTKINSLLAVGDHDLWVGTDNGVAHWNGQDLTSAPAPAALAHVQALAMASDRDGNIWIGTAQGLLRVSPQGTVTPLDNTESIGTVTSIFEDREGNLWAGGTSGICRLRDATFSTFSVKEGLPSNSNGAIYADSIGRIWFAPIEGGLFWIQDGKVSQVTADGLEKDIVYSITGANGELWIGRQRGGLTHLTYDQKHITAHTYTHRDGLAQDSVYTVHRSRDGAIWAGTLSGGVSVLRDGRFSTYSVANGLLSDTVNSVIDSPDGTVWFGTTSGLTALSGGRWKTFVTQDGLPSDEINALHAGPLNILWVGTAKGLAILDRDGVHVPAAGLDTLHRPIFGIAEDREGSMWITTAARLLRFNQEELLHASLEDSGIREFGLADGLQSVEGVRRSQSVVTDPLGRVWFSMGRGISVTNPARSLSGAPAIAQIENASADGSPLDLRAVLHIPASSQRIAFDFSGVSLSIPERVRFRYKLDGFDRNWSAPLATREAVYTNLDPGAYQFRVLASNGDGQWNSPEAVTRFIIEPALWQTWWFRVLCVVAVMAAVVLAFRLRMLQMTAQLNLRFEERLAERTRIAQELHDTLLQGCLSASMQLDVAYDQLPGDSPVKPSLGRILQLMRQVVDEGRNALLGLRSRDRNPDALEQSFSRVAQELAIYEQVSYRLHTVGKLRPLHPLIRDEVYRIGREALVNAFRHADATAIDVELTYAANHLCLSVRDDGCGIDEHILQSGREGHWGLPGMRERAQRIGAKLRVLNSIHGGAEVELIVPSQIAYQTPTEVAGLIPGFFLRGLQWRRAPKDRRR